MRTSEALLVALGDRASSGQAVQRRPLWHRRWLVMLAVSLAACLIIFLRRPDALLNPQFLAEDGTYFYAQAYNLGGLQTLWLPIAGYLVTLDRMIAAFAVVFPLAWGPAIFNALAVLIQASPVAFLFTDRFDQLIPNWYVRAAIGFLYLAIPNSVELDATVTNAQWHFALLAFLVVIAAPRSALWWRILDGAIILLFGLSGPFCLFMAPIILLRWLRTRSPRLIALFTINLLSMVIQIVVLLANSSADRARTGLGISGVELARIIAGQILVSITWGTRTYYLVYTSGWWTAGWLPVLLTIAGATFLGFTLRQAPQELRLLWLFGALTFVAALLSPVTSGPGTYWQRLAHPMWNMRYVFFLNVAWLTTLVWALVRTRKHQRWLHRLALVLLAFTCFMAIPLDWQYPPFANHHYQAYIDRFEQLPPGSHLTIPVDSFGGTWTMTLIKR